MARPKKKQEVIPGPVEKLETDSLPVKKKKVDFLPYAQVRKEKRRTFGTPIDTDSYHQKFNGTVRDRIPVVERKK